MGYYILIELDDGFSIAAVPGDQSAEEVARDAGGEVHDEGPYPTYQSAQEALGALPNPYAVQREED